MFLSSFFFYHFHASFAVADVSMFFFFPIGLMLFSGSIINLVLLSKCFGDFIMLIIPTLFSAKDDHIMHFFVNGFFFLLQTKEK